MSAIVMAAGGISGRSGQCKLSEIDPLPTAMGGSYHYNEKTFRPCSCSMASSPSSLVWPAESYCFETTGIGLLLVVGVSHALQIKRALI